MPAAQTLRSPRAHRIRGGEETRRRGRSRQAVLVTMCVGYFLVLLDVTIVNVALPRIGSGLHAHVSGLQWVVDGYGVAPDVTALIAARAIQGVGAAMLLPGTLAIISHAFPDGHEQARAIGVWAGIGSLALPAGPLLGGALIAGLGWRAIFLINVPIV